MIAMQAIHELSKHIAEQFEPSQIILFGSYAYGTPRPDSDVDLLVVMPYEGHAAYKAIEILERVNSPFAVDLVVRSPQEIRQRLSLNDFFLRDVVTKGQVLHAATDRGVGG